MTENKHESWHRRMLEGKSALFAVLITVGMSIGGLVEILPMYTVQLGPEKVEGLQPYTALEQAGRDIYIREGCYNCHSQMIRPFRSETLRYGTWSRGGEFVYDHPFQLGSRRIGPDLARLGGKYPDSWHYEHMRDPRTTSPDSIMPVYPWLLDSKVDPDDIRASLTALQTVGVPYSDDDINNVDKQIADQGGKIADNLKSAGLQAEPDDEIVAVIAYLQSLGVAGKQAFKDGAK